MARIFDPSVKSAVNEAFNKLLRFAGMVNVPAISFTDVVNTATTEAMKIYVDGALGNDLNAGSQTQPFKTIQAAVDSLPKTIRHPVTVTVAAGNYAGYQVAGFSVEPSLTGTANSLVIQGTLITAAPATGTASGTLSSFAAASGATFAVATDSTQTWTTNDLRGKMIEFTGGTGGAATSIFEITSNTSTTITFVASFATGGSDTTYVIRDWATSINSTIPATGAVVNTTVSDAAAGVRLANNTCGSTGGNAIVISKMAITLSSQTLVAHAGPGRATFAWLKLNDLGVSSASTTGINCFDTASTTIHACYMNLNGSAAGVINTGGLLSVTRTYFEGCDTQISGAGRVSTSANYHRNSTFAAISPNFGGTPGTMVIATSRIDGALQGIYGISDTSTGVACRFIISTNDISNCTLGAIVLRTRAVQATVISCTGTSNTAGFLVTNGAYCKVNSATTLTGTTECTVDTTDTTLATMRGLSPKAFPAVASPYGTALVE